MKPRLPLAAVLALIGCLLLGPPLSGPAWSDDSSDPTAPSSTALPDAEGDEPGGAQAVTVGIQTATGKSPDDRGHYEYEIEPSRVRQDYVAVLNYSDKPVDVTLPPRDATTTADAPFAVQPNAAKASDVGAWIAISEPRLHLEPRSQTLVPFQVGVPYDATPGDHVGAIVLTVGTAGKDAEGEQVVVENRVGLRVYLRVPGSLRPELAVDDLKAHFDGSLATFGVGRNTVDYTVRNTGNVRLSATQVVDMLRSVGLSDVQASPDDIPEMLPGGHVDVHQVSDRFFAVGPLRTRVTVTPSSGDPAVEVGPVQAQVSQNVLPYGLVVLVLLLLLVAGLITRLVRRWRRRRPPKVKNPSHRRAGPPPGPGEPADREPVNAGVRDES